MIKRILIMVLSVITIAFGQKEFGKITLPLGRVEVQSAGSDQWKRAGVNKTVFVNDKIRTRAKSRAAISLISGGEMRIGQNSTLELMRADVMAMQKEFQANLEKGNIWVSAEAGFGVKNNVSVGTPTAVAAIRGTKYRVTAGDEESSVLVYNGKVDVNSAKNVTEAREKQMRQGFQPQGGAPKFKLGPVQEVDAPTQVAGPYEVSLEDWVSLVEGMQINLRSDGKYHMFEFNKEADALLDWVKWNRELDAK